MVLQRTTRRARSSDHDEPIARMPFVLHFVLACVHG